MPAPTPDKAMPPTNSSYISFSLGEGERLSVYLHMKIFMVCAVDDIIEPSMMKNAPVSATYRRPSKSESDPTNGQIAARARRFARTWDGLRNQLCYRCELGTSYKPNPSISAANVSIDIGRDST